MKKKYLLMLQKLNESIRHNVYIEIISYYTLAIVGSIGILFFVFMITGQIVFKTTLGDFLVTTVVGLITAFSLMKFDSMRYEKEYREVMHLDE